MKNETVEKQLNLLTKDFELMKVKNGELKDDLTKLKTQTTSTTENIKTEVKQLAVGKTLKIYSATLPRPGCRVAVVPLETFLTLLLFNLYPIYPNSVVFRKILLAQRPMQAVVWSISNKATVQMALTRYDPI